MAIALINKYEYIGLAFDFSDLSEMNRLSSDGWHVIFVTQPHVIFTTRTDKSGPHRLPFIALMERCTPVVQSR